MSDLLDFLNRMERKADRLLPPPSSTGDRQHLWQAWYKTLTPADQQILLDYFGDPFGPYAPDSGLIRVCYSKPGTDEAIDRLNADFNHFTGLEEVWVIQVDLGYDDESTRRRCDNWEVIRWNNQQVQRLSSGLWDAL